MKIKVLAIIITSLVLFGSVWMTANKTVWASCGCAMECGNRCSANCDNCGNSCWQQAADCCLAAHKATGDTEACPVGGGEN